MVLLMALRSNEKSHFLCILALCFSFEFKSFDPILYSAIFGTTPGD